LTDILLQVKIQYHGDVDVAKALFRLTTPNLRKLEVERVDSRGEFGPRSHLLYLALLSFMIRNKESLRDLKLISTLTDIYTL
jgi:hypothetical protein